MTRLRIIGDIDRTTAYSLVNRAWVSGLRAAGLEIRRDGRADVILHHDYTENFGTCAVDPAPVRVAVRTWDFGPYPASWVDRIEADFDRLWVHSHWTRAKAIEGGLSAERVATVPLGFDPSIYAPGGPVGERDEETFTFLFVGATVVRKGIDILLQAYADAFGPDDPVRLVLKGNASDVFYRGQRMEKILEDFSGDPSKPDLEHIDAFMRQEELAKLYRSADAAVFPYRAEGFAIPILEAMACGVPCIVPRFGACLDFCTEETVCFVEPRRVRLPVGRQFQFNALGFSERVERVDFCQIVASELSVRLREVFETGREQLRARGQRAAAHAHAHWTWSHSVEQVIARLREVGCEL